MITIVIDLLEDDFLCQSHKQDYFYLTFIPEDESYSARVVKGKERETII